MLGRFKDWKACLVVIGQTAHRLETNAHANFPLAENLAYQCIENGGRNMHMQIYLWLSGTILRQIQAPSSVSRERAESFLSIFRRTNADQKYHQWRQLTHLHITIARRRPSSLLRPSRVLRFPC